MTRKVAGQYLLTFRPCLIWLTNLYTCPVANGNQTDGQGLFSFRLLRLLKNNFSKTLDRTRSGLIGI